MRFTIKQTGCGSERVGFLNGFLKNTGTVIETPTSALLTQGGSVVHLTADVLARVFSNPQLLWVPLTTSHHLENGLKAQGEGVAKFAALPKHIVCGTLQNISEEAPLGHFEANKVPLWTKNGKKMVTADRYMEMMELLKPDLLIAIFDGRLSLNEGAKRIVKSVERTSNMLETCINRYKASDKLRNSGLIGVIVGTAQDKACEESIKHIIKHSEHLTGVALAGISDGTAESFGVPVENLVNIFKKVDEAVPKDLVRIIEGCWNPAVVVAAIEHGWDMFDGSYPLKLTNAGNALTLDFDVSRNSDELCILDLNDARYKEEFRPILDGCECLACKKHTRAYIRHLLNTREMLSNVLLSIHNLHHFDQMFLHARRHIEAKTYSAFKNHITKQYELYKISQISTNDDVKSDTDQVSMNPKETTDIVQQKKKIRVVSSDNCVPDKSKVTNGRL